MPNVQPELDMGIGDSNAGYELHNVQPGVGVGHMGNVTVGSELSKLRCEQDNAARCGGGP